MLLSVSLSSKFLSDLFVFLLLLVCRCFLLDLFLSDLSLLNLSLLDLFFLSLLVLFTRLHSSFLTLSLPFFILSLIAFLSNSFLILDASCRNMSSTFTSRANGLHMVLSVLSSKLSSE